MENLIVNGHAQRNTIDTNPFKKILLPYKGSKILYSILRFYLNLSSNFKFKFQSFIVYITIVAV